MTQDERFTAALAPARQLDQDRVAALMHELAAIMRERQAGPDPDEVITLTEAAATLGLTATGLRAQARRGRLDGAEGIGLSHARRYSATRDVCGGRGSKMAQGTVEKRISKAGKVTWRAKYDLGPHPETGARRRGSSSHPTKPAAQAALRKHLTAVDQGKAVARNGETFGKRAQLWYDSHPEWTPSTVTHYRWLLDKHILPTLGAVQLQKIDASTIQRFILTKKAAPRIAQMVYNLLRQIFAGAVRLGVVAVNPVDAIDCPRVAHKERPVWTKPQARAFLAEAAKDGTYGPLWQLLTEGGLRREDALGLRWQDVDLSAGKITIRQAVVAAGGKTKIVDKPKTPSARRSIALSAPLLEWLGTWKVAMVGRRDKVGELWQDNDLVFPSQVGTPINPNNLSRVYNPLVQRAGIPRIRIHDIRHTSSALVLDGGGTLLALSQRLGHARPSTTANLYGHVTQGMADTASLAIADALYGDD